MVSRLASFRPAGTAEARAVRRASGIDLGLAAATAVLLWPFPLVRLTLGVPWSVHGPLIVLWILLVHALYLALCARVWGRTPALYFMDLGLDGHPRPFRSSAALMWGLGWTIAVVPGLLGAAALTHPEHGLPARWSGLLTVSALPADEDVRDG